MGRSLLAQLSLVEVLAAQAHILAGAAQEDLIALLDHFAVHHAGVADGLAAAEIAEREGVSVEVVDMRWAKPVDEQMVAEVAAKFRRVVTVEDGVVDGGAGSAVATMLAQMGYDGVVECLGIKDKFVQHASVAEQKAECEYDTDGIVKALLKEKK